MQALMKVGNEFLATQLTVLESNDMPFLFGLDMLRRHQCQIDLKWVPLLRQRSV
jgi:DNA damage-inducible protein 1